VKQNLIPQSTTEPHSGRHNRCDDEIQEFRKHFQRIMVLNRCPEAFWDFALEYIIRVRQFVIRRAADKRSPIETITVETPDSTEFMDVDLYQFIKYRDANADRDDPIKLGRWLGIAHEVGTQMT
jgi:hypothetical protein